jgi:hypothetical protein
MKKIYASEDGTLRFTHNGAIIAQANVPEHARRLARPGMHSWRQRPRRLRASRCGGYAGLTGRSIRIGGRNGIGCCTSGTPSSAAEHNIGGMLKSASYIESWIKNLKDDPTAFAKAAAAAQRSVNFLHGQTAVEVKEAA